MLREQPPKRGGIRRSRLHLIEQTFFEVISRAIEQPIQRENGPPWQGAIWGGGGDLGYLELGPRTPPWVRGSKYKKKVLQDPGPNTHPAATLRKQALTPPPSPTPPQKRYPSAGGGGGTGVKIQKIIGGSFFGPKMMILQGVRHQKPYMGYATRTTPKNGGVYDACACA